MDTRAKNPIGNDIPTIRANREEINAAFGLLACLQEMKKAEETIKRRFKAVPNGWRNIRMIETVLGNMIDDLLLTYPIEKLCSMQRMMPHMKFRLSCGVSASKVREDECIIDQKDLHTLSVFAHEQCKLCVDQNCGRCKLGKVFDGILCDDRDDRSWANVDIDVLNEVQ